MASGARFEVAGTSRDRVTIDLRGIGDAVRAAAAVRGMGVAQLVRRALVMSLDLRATATVASVKGGSDGQTPARETAKLTLRLSQAHADALMLNAAALGLLCNLADCARSESAVALDTHGGQNMYTPQNLRRPAPSPYDRPYAGWLYLGNRTRLADLPDDQAEATREQSFDLIVGVVGKQAGAAKVQEEWHHLVNAIDPQGWSYQLKTEPTLQLSYTYKRRFALGSVVDSLPYVQLTAGNVFTHVAVGGQVRWGRDLGGFGHFDPAPSAIPTAAFAPLKLRAPEEGKERARRDSPLYAFVAVEGRAVARNIFIDGNTWKDYPEVSYIKRKPLVGDVTVGFSWRYTKTCRITYGHTWRSKEFTHTRQPPPQEPRPAVQRYGIVQFQWET